MNRRHLIDDIDAIAGDVPEPPPRIVLPGTELDPDWFAVTFSDRLCARTPVDAVSAAAEPWNPESRLVEFPCGAIVNIPPYATADVVEALYVRARLDRILWLMNSAGEA